MTASTWDRLADCLPPGCSLERTEDHARLHVAIATETIILDARIREWGETRWLWLGGLVGPARHVEPASLVAENATRIIGTFEVTREGDVWLRHTLLVDESSSELATVVAELVSELRTRRLSMPSNKT